MRNLYFSTDDDSFRDYASLFTKTEQKQQQQQQLLPQSMLPTLFLSRNQMD
jgi:hypothetical protein